MESNVHREDFVSQEEVGLPENENSLTIGRSYECVFCKRGFNSAQALGGHMNIHRKDRARNKPSSLSLVVVNPDKHIIIGPDPRFYHQIISPTSYQPHHQYDLRPQLIDNRWPSSSCFQSSGDSPAQPFSQNYHYFNNQWFKPFGFDSSMSFDMPCGSSAHVEDLEKSRPGVSQEEELDLELRLGGP